MTALITDMSWPLGSCVGNAIEVNECVSFMKSPVFEGRFYEAIALVGGEMYRMAGKGSDGESAIRHALESGQAYEKFLQMVSVQGGDVTALDRGLPVAPVCLEVKAAREGWVQPMDTFKVGILLNEIGGGRQKMEDSIDVGAGLEICVRQGEKVKPGMVVAKIYTRNREEGRRAVGVLQDLIAIGDEKIECPPVFRGKRSTLSGS